MSEHRREIVGLRAIAVVLVVLFHVKATFVPGGYIGVDVFFVISGFLITRKLVHEVDRRGSIDIPLFLAGRMRRLFPALFVTMLASFVAAWFLLSPDALQRFAAGAFHALLYLSNIFHWTESGYFNTAAYTKPDLHTWSLSVEEQFYWIWPLLILLVRKRGRRGLLAMFAAVFAISLLLNQAISWIPHRVVAHWVPIFWRFEAQSASAMFFLMPFRMFEFAIGALCFLATERYSPRPAIATVAQLAGLGMIAVSAWLFTEATPFPGFAALLPCIGTALVILGGEKSRANVLLSNPLTDVLGRSSYSIYLVHWPLIVFYLAYRQTVEISLPAAAGLFAGSLLLGYLLYVAIEYPFWQRRYLPRLGPVGFSAISLVCMLALALPLANAWTTGGWAGRFVPLATGSTSRPFRTRLSDTRKPACRRAGSAPGGAWP